MPQQWVGHPGSDITDSPIYVDNINLSRSHAFVAAEIENKSKACSNASYQCSAAMRVDGFKYCIQHILQDKAAIYRIEGGTMGIRLWLICQ